MLNNTYYIITEYYLEELQVIKMLCVSYNNAVIHARLLKSNHPNSYYEYRVYEMKLGVIYLNQQPIFDTKGDEFQW